jgi:hypothetical protein
MLRTNCEAVMWKIRRAPSAISSPAVARLANASLVYMGHSIDNVSSDANYQNVPLGQSVSSAERGPSDYDIRQTFSGAVSYDIPAPGGGVLK